MPRNITVTFSDGTSHTYQNAPDDVTPEQVTQRAQTDFGKSVTELDGGKSAGPKASPKPPPKLNRDQAQTALQQGEAALANQTAGMAPNVAADARRRFYADPRISRLQATMQGAPKTAASAQHSFLGDLGSATKNVAAGVAQGITGIPDVMTEGIAGATRMITAPAAKAATTLYNALGMPEQAQAVTRNAATFDRGLSRPFTLGSTIEGVAPTPQDTVGKVARFGAQMVGGALVPAGPKITPPAKLPQVMAKQAPNAAADVIQAGEKAGVRVLTSDVKPPRTFVGKSVQALGERIPFAGTGGVRQAQQGERIAAVKNLLNDYGAADAASASDDVAADLVKTRGAQLSRLTKAKDAVIDSLGGAVPTPNAVRAIDEQIARLKGINENAYQPVIAKLDEFKTVLTSGKNLRQIEGNRKLLGDLFKDPNLATISGEGQKAVNAIYSPLRSDMGAFIGSAGGKGAFNRWKNANDQLAAMAGELNNSAFRNVLKSADATPENVARLLFSQKPSDVARLYANLSPAGQGKAQAAVLHRALDKAGGLENLSPDKFANEIDRLGKSVGVVFKGDDLARVEGLSRLLGATKRASVASAAPPTGVQNSLPIIGAVLADMMGSAGAAIATGGGMGLLARAYESAPVRNALLRVGKTQTGSKAEGIAMRRASEILAKALSGPMRSIAPAANDTVPVSALAGETPEDQQQK